MHSWAEDHLECAEQLLADRRAPAKVLEREAAATAGASTQLLRANKCDLTRGNPVVSSCQVAIASEPPMGMIKVGLLGVCVPRVACCIGRARLATAEGPVVVRVMKVAECRLKAATVRRVACSCHPSVPFACGTQHPEPLPPQAGTSLW